ncbi:MAG: hemin ABC transporter ATP-binding protein, partial [Acidimicrobiia bacterium]
RRERVVVAVLHDLNAAAYYADRVVLMAEGSIRAEGPPRGVFVENILSEVYRQRMRIIDHPFRDCPLILVAD